jgi:hypothetical protein
MSKYAASAIALFALVACKPSAPPPPAQGSPPQATTMASAAASSAATTTPTLGRGDVAPPFSLQGSDGKLHALSDDAGKDVVVIAWFPKAFTGG